MTYFSLMAIAIGGATAFAPLALQAQGQAAVADPQATVPGVVYQSVFKESPTGVETQSVDWKKANADVAQFPRGHVDILKWEEAQIKARSLVKPMARPGEIPPAPTTPVPPATVHKH